MSWNFGTLHYQKPDRIEMLLPADKPYDEFIDLMTQTLMTLGYTLQHPPMETERGLIVVFRRPV